MPIEHKALETVFTPAGPSWHGSSIKRSNRHFLRALLSRSIR